MGGPRCCPGGATPPSAAHRPTLHDEEPLKTDDIFVTLTLEYGGNREGRFSHRDLLTAGDRLRIVGDPGSGKSSLVKRVFRDACAEGIHNSRKARIPIMLELKEWDPPRTKVGAEALGKWALDDLRARVAAVKGYEMEEFFNSYVATVGVLVLLDGLDEVSGSAFDRAANAIIGLSRQLELLSPNNVIVLTMRTQFHRQVSDRFTDHFPPTLYIRSFTPPEIYDFLTRWPFRDNQEATIARIYSDLTDRPTLRDMCSNPLILSMYVANDQSSESFGLPETRTEFYSKVTEELLIARRARQLGSTAARSTLRNQREAILGRLAFDNLADRNQPANSLRWDHALKVVSEVIQSDDMDLSEAHLRELSKETGLVTEEPKGERMRFIHLTFCEFLAAKECTQRRDNGWNDLMEAHRAFASDTDPQLSSRLVEVIPFACALLPPVRQSQAVSIQVLVDPRPVAGSVVLR
jgi:predicted NACHT family NTPase